MKEVTPYLSSSGTVLTIGATGHRDLRGREDAIRRQITFALRALVETHGTAGLVVVCSVAEGADRLVLKAAEGLGIPFDCVLPCSPDCFRQDFDGQESHKEFDRLLRDVRSVEMPDASVDKEAGYLWANGRVLQRADVLLAVWDGKQGNGPAGTAETVKRARLLGIPVIQIEADAPHEICLLEPEGRVPG